MKNQATQNACENMKRKPILKQMMQRLNIFKAKIDKPDILDLFSPEVLKKATKSEESKIDEKIKDKKEETSKNDKGIGTQLKSTS